MVFRENPHIQRKLGRYIVRSECPPTLLDYNVTY